MLKACKPSRCGLASFTMAVICSPLKSHFEHRQQPPPHRSCDLSEGPSPASSQAVSEELSSLAVGERRCLWLTRQGSGSRKHEPSDERFGIGPSLMSSCSFVYLGVQHVLDGLWVGKGLPFRTKAKNTRDK